MTFRKSRTAKVPGNVKKARKSAALIVAETRLADLEKRLDKIESLLWKVAYGVGAALLSALGTLALLYFNPHAQVHLG